MPGQKRFLNWKKFISLVLVLSLIIGVYVRYTSALPVLQPIYFDESQSIQPAVKLAWPAYGQSAIGAVGYGVLGRHGSTQPLPMASLAKVVTALVVLDKSPLSAGQQGPTITLTAADVAIYKHDLAQNGSVIQVAAGEKLTLFQALQAMLLPSANNMAESLANWTYGSASSFLTAANQYLASQGLKDTILADASGFSPGSKSTASELIKIGEIALAQPVLADIVSQRLAEIPVAGTIYNRNTLVGSDGNIGIKTGNSDEAGGCILLAMQKSFGTQKLIILDAVLGASDLKTAMDDGHALLNTAANGFSNEQVIGVNEIIGQYHAPWGETIKVTPAHALSLLRWKNSKVNVKVDLKNIKLPATKGSVVGQVAISSGNKSVSVPAILDRNIPMPTLKWRLLR